MDYGANSKNLFLGKSVNNEWIGDTIEIGGELKKVFSEVFSKNKYDIKRTLETLSKLYNNKKEIKLINLEESDLKDVVAYIVYNEQLNRLEMYCDVINSFFVYKGREWTYRPELFCFIDLIGFKEVALENEIKRNFYKLLVKCNNEQAARSVIQKDNLRKRSYIIHLDTYADENEIRKAIDKVNSKYINIEDCIDFKIEISEDD